MSKSWPVPLAMLIGAIAGMLLGAWVAPDLGEAVDLRVGGGGGRLTAIVVGGALLVGLIALLQNLVHLAYCAVCNLLSLEVPQALER